LRVAYLGTSEFAVAVLKRLADSAHRPALVVAPPDRPKGRGRRMASPPVADAARELGLELLQTENINRPDAVGRMRAVTPQVAVVCAFGQLIKDPLLSELLMLNVHPSLLPRWRGAAPIERAILAGDERTGVTIIRVGAGYDSGPMAVQREVAIGAHEDYESLAGRLAKAAGELIVDALDLHQAGRLEFTEQDESLATYAEKIDPIERRLDPSRRADELERTVRAMNPHHGTYLELVDGERLAVRTAIAEDGQLARGRLVAQGGALRLGCASGVLRLELVQPAGRRPMAVDAYLRGHPVPELER
jgi:methionyl-tRNA formyltransferase